MKTRSARSGSDSVAAALAMSFASQAGFDIAEARKMDGNPLLDGFVEKVQAHLARYRAGQAVRSGS